jgi:hypothetical protein
MGKVQEEVYKSKEGHTFWVSLELNPPTKLYFTERITVEVLPDMSYHCSSYFRGWQVYCLCENTLYTPVIPPCISLSFFEKNAGTDFIKYRNVIDVTSG